MNYDGNQPCAVTQADLDREILHDSLSQQFNYGESFHPEIEAEISRRVDERVMVEKCEAVSQVMAILLRGGECPRRTAAFVAFASGMFIHQGLGMVDLAKKFGTSKQAFQQGVMRVSRDLGLDPTRAMKAEESRKQYSLSNHRKTKHANTPVTA